MNPRIPSSSDSAVIIPGSVGKLEALLTRPDPAGELYGNNYVAVVCHPHPVYGGSMVNKVVTTLMRSYRDLGVTVVRFNFRGVGESAGSFDQGKGEVDDLLAVLAWVEQEFSGAELLLAGFSFGSAIAAQVSYRCARLRHLLLVAPPVERYPYDKNHRFDCPLCVIQGDKDERVSATGVYNWLESLASPTELIRYENATHFFHGCLAELKRDLMQSLAIVLKPQIQTLVSQRKPL